MSIDRKPSASSGETPFKLPDSVPRPDVPLGEGSRGEKAVLAWHEGLDKWWLDVKQSLERRFEELEKQ